MMPIVFWKLPSAIPQRSAQAYRSQMSSHGWRLEKFPLESHVVGIIGIMVHDPIHVGSRLLGTGDSFGKVSRALWGGHVNGFIYHLFIAL